MQRENESTRGKNGAGLLPAPRYELTETRNLSYHPKLQAFEWRFSNWRFSFLTTGHWMSDREKREEKEKMKLITLCTTPVDSGYSLIVTLKANRVLIVSNLCKFPDLY